MKSRKNKASEKAQEALNQMHKRNKTINQIRNEYGLPAIKECSHLTIKE